MSSYRLFQINTADQIVDGHVVACGGDDEATALAPQFLSGYAAVEVWCDRRRITRIGSPGSAAANTADAHPVPAA